MPLRILIVGAGVAGTALALLLQHSPICTSVAVIERSPSLRLAGQQIDVKHEALTVIRKLGLLATLRSRCVTENGSEVVDSNGKIVVQFGVSDGEGKQTSMGFTQEYEIMRGDLVELLYETSLKRAAERRTKAEQGETEEGMLKYEFGKTITQVMQSGEHVDVVFEDDKREQYDIVIGADGQSSRTRRLAFGQQASDEAFAPLGLHAAFYSVPNEASDTDSAKWYLAPRRRGLMTRTSGRHVTQAYLFNLGDSERLNSLRREPVEAQKKVWAENFADAGWQADRLIRGLETCDDFYAVEGGLMKMRQLFTGRVVLMGESGYGGTFTGVGTELAIIGAYVFVGELTQHGDGDVTGALKSYEKVMKDPIDEWIHMPPKVLGLMFPSSQIGIRIVYAIMWVLSKLLPIVSGWIPQSSNGWKIPQYSELELES